MKIDTTEFENMTDSEKITVFFELLEVRKLLVQKEEYLLANQPKWWQFFRKRRYRKAVQQWCDAVDTYNAMIYAYRQATVFEDPFDELIKLFRDADLHDDVQSNTDGERSD